jgi:hypothetical protein
MDPHLSIPSGDHCDAKLVSNIFCEYVDVDERREATLIHDDTTHQDTGQLFMNFCRCRKSDVCCSFLCLGVFCLFAGLWCLKFVSQWR